jgi:hypothetical protein
MKVRNLLLGTALFVTASVANATTIWLPTDGDINFSLQTGALGSYELRIFDEEAGIPSGDSLLVVTPDLIYVNGSTSLHYNSDFSDTGLAYDGDFVLAVSNDGFATWTTGDANMASTLTVPEANMYAVKFGNIGGFELVIDVTPVPVPAAVWLFGSGLLGLVGVARRRA